MSDVDLQIGIENELFLNAWSGKTSYTSADTVEIADHANSVLLPFYNKERGRDLLGSNFSLGSNPGHDKNHIDHSKWTVATDISMGKIENDENVDGCTYSKNLRHVSINIRLTYIQVPSRSSLRYLASTLTAHGKQK